MAEFDEIVEVMDAYHCHLSIQSEKKNNRCLWWYIYNEDGNLVAQNKGTRDIETGNVAYSIYGSQESASNLANSILKILTSMDN